MGDEFVGDEHEENGCDNDTSEGKLATDGRDARSLAPKVVPHGATVEHDMPDGKQDEEHAQNIVGGMPCVSRHRDW